VYARVHLYTHTHTITHTHTHIPSMQIVTDFTTCHNACFNLLSNHVTNQACVRARAPPSMQVVTDFTTCHNTWFHSSVTRCFVPTELCAGLARKNGLVQEQLIQRGGRLCVCVYVCECARAYVCACFFMCVAVLDGRPRLNVLSSSIIHQGGGQCQFLA